MEAVICLHCAQDKPEKCFDPQPRKDGTFRFQKNCNTCRCKLVKYRKFGKLDLTPPSPYFFCEESWRDFKICSACKMPKTTDRFVKHQGRAVSDCKDCRRTAQQQRMASDRREEFLAKNRARNQRNITPEKKAIYNENRKTPEKRKRDNLKNRRMLIAKPELYRTYKDNAKRARAEQLAGMTATEREAFLERERAGRRMRRLIRRARESGAEIIEPVTKRAVVGRYGSKCYLCGKNLAYRDVTIDHVEALANGGAHDLTNTRPACKPCNLSKGAKPLEKHLADQTLRLFRIPEVPY